MWLRDGVLCVVQQKQDCTMSSGDYTAEPCTDLDNNEEVLVWHIADACNFWLYCTPGSRLSSQLKSLPLQFAQWVKWSAQGRVSMLQTVVPYLDSTGALDPSRTAPMPYL